MMKIYIPLLFIFISFYSNAQKNWVLKKSDDEIKVYVRDNDSLKLKEYKAITTINVAKSKVVQTILDAENIKKWNYKTSESRLVKKTGDSIYHVYLYNDLPWPVMNRDFISKLTVKNVTNKITKILIEGNQKDDVPVKKGVIRLRKFGGYWLVEETPNGIKITQQLYGDPEGNLPNFIINSTLVSAPFNTFLKLREILSK